MENWKSTILSPDSKIIQAINVLNQEISKIILVCDESDCLIGTVTDGDIRRALIKNVLIDSKLKKIMSMN
jgi:predicted transcriptional regulator